VDLSPGARIELPAAQGRHLVRVLRLAAGTPIVLFNGQGGEFEAIIATIHRDDITVHVGAHQAIERESPLDITLLQGIARGEKMDLILQKATELGVTRIVPLNMARSNVRLTSDTAARKQEHWQAVVDSACEQCGRNRVPEVAAPTPFASAVQAVRAGTRLLLAPAEDSRSLATMLAPEDAGANSTFTLLVGPEGGFEPDEVRIARLAGFTGCRLGPRVLRTETAALTALAALRRLQETLAGSTATGMRCCHAGHDRQDTECG
jgi:16S rRNA (uracil1498-N3)-methyltransferase